MNEKELLKLIKDMYEAMYSENMHCPCCTGHIGYENENHDDYCRLYKALKEANHEFPFGFSVDGNKI